MFDSRYYESVLEVRLGKNAAAAATGYKIPIRNSFGKKKINKTRDTTSFFKDGNLRANFGV